jgi:hypothetical protein
MHPYLPHLLSDIKAAHRDESTEPDQPKTFLEELEEVERWLEREEPYHSFSYHCGLESEQFPPAEQLNPDEMNLISKAFKQMMYSWNLDVELPETMPADRYYSLLVETLNLNTEIVNTGFITLGFCQYYPPGCILKEYCLCCEIWDSDSEEEDSREK